MEVGQLAEDRLDYSRMADSNGLIFGMNVEKHWIVGVFYSMIL